MNQFLYISTPLVLSFILMIIIVPIIKKIAIKTQLVDKPNHRKLHETPIPLVGGISIAISLFIIGTVYLIIHSTFRSVGVIFTCAYLLLIVGVIDDRFDIKAKYKLLVQLICALAIAAVGIRITSFYGFLGIYEIPIVLQYIITTIIICGVINSFNLMDGIDGLAGELSLIGFIGFLFLSIIVNDSLLISFYAILIGAVSGFLKFNFSKEKIFMGDAGSLFIGTIMIGSAIYFLNNKFISPEKINYLLFSIISFFAIPVLDSLRVYLGRIKKGNSPFEPDKTHLHHLFLLLKLSHKKTSLIIAIFVILSIVFAIIVPVNVSLNVFITIIVLTFSVLGFFLNLNKKLQDWQRIIKELEK